MIVLLKCALAAPPEIAGRLTERPLAPLSGPGGKTMFTELSAEQTGIVTENRYSDPKMLGELYHEFEVGEIGTGVAIGDYDGDGRPDIFVVSKTETCRLFRNLGGWKFEDVTDRAGVGDKGDAAGIWKQGATFVDVNNDGLLDIYVCRFNASNLLYINQGNGTFKEMAREFGLDVKDASVMAMFCDYDRDGALDMFLQTNILDANQHPNGQRNYLFHNNRDGTFTNVTERAGISGEGQGHSAVWWDYDDDGWPDLYVGNDFQVPDKFYHNNRDGTFTNIIAKIVPHTPYSSMGSDLGDLNNDGLIDFIITDMAATTHEKDQRGMADSRARAREQPADTASAPQYERNALFINTGTDRFLEAAHLTGLAATDWSWSPRFEDFDNDGRIDLFVTNGMDHEATNVDLMMRQMSAETATERIRIMRDSPMLAEPNLAFRNLGDLTFENVGAAWGLNQRGVSFGSACGDLDGDGDLDIVYANYRKGLTILRNDCATGHRVIVELRGNISNKFGVGAKVRVESSLGIQVRQLVLARGVLSNSEPVLHFGLGNDTSLRRLTVSWPSGLIQTFTDLPVDRRFTIDEPAGPAPALSSESSPRAVGQFTEVSRSTGLALASREDDVDETAMQRLLPIRLNQRGPSLAIGDLDGDGNDDVVLGGTTRDPLRILLGSGKPLFTEVDAPVLATANSVDDGPVLLFDAEGNGTNALLVSKGGNSLPAGAPEYQPKLYLNDGHGHFRPASEEALPPLPIGAGTVVAGDFDRDGRLDLFIGGRVLPGQYPLSPQSALLANRGGKFEDVTDRLAPGLREVGMVTSALWTDVDGDGWPDLLLTLEWGTIRYFHNNEGKRFEDWSEKAGFAAAGTGWWTSLAAADFNGDGRPDYVVGNVGLNTPYHASAAHPALLFYGEFKGEGEQPQIIEAYYEGDRLFPWRSRRDLGAAIPSVLKRFPQNNAYARATLGEIVGESALNSAHRYAATEFRSGVFLSEPDGKFHFEPLPRIAQIAPLQGIVAEDFDGDGFADIYAVQNSYAPVPAVGRFDGGVSQLLRGDGHGHFRPASSAETHLVVPGDAKALTTLDLNADSWPDFVVSQNNGAMIAFQNNRVEGRHALCIKLRGPAGNPTAIGARITLRLIDGSMETSEVYCGSGYYSQSAASCFFGFTDANPPKRLEIRWPSGKTTEHSLPPTATTVTFSYEGAE